MASISNCKLSSVLQTIGDHWTLGILHELSVGPRRTLDLYQSFTGLSTKTMAARLKQLRRNGIIDRKSYPESPPRVEYFLTERGQEILPVLRSIAELAARWDGGEEVAAQHAPCRACAAGQTAAFGEPDFRPGAPSRPRREQDPARPETLPARKRTDVTLL